MEKYDEIVRKKMKKVLVMMSTYNGERYLREQIDSIMSQSGVEVYLQIRDDGSTDYTKDILKEYSKKNNINYYFGQNVGYARSFWDLIMKADNFDYYAFADQDDVWKENKLYNAIERLKNVNNEVCLYSSGLEIVDENLHHINNRKFEGIKISLGSALVRQRLPGCTMVFNNKLLELCKMCKFDQNSNFKFGHDGLVYLTCLAVGGNVILNDVYDIKFRRHSTTQTNAGRGIKKRIKNELSIFKSKRGNKYQQANIIYVSLKDHLTKQANDLLKEITSYKDNKINTIKLLMNNNLSSGIKSVDILIRIAILFRCF